MKRVITLALIVILALTAVGFGYAKWSSSVDAKVTVNTGSVLIGIRDVGTNDDGSDVGVPDELSNTGTLGADPQWGLGLNSEKKDVASKVSTNTGKVVGQINGVDYFDSISEIITNAYPYYGPSSVIEIANLGTIPVKLETLTWNWAPGSVINDQYYDIVNWSFISANGSIVSGVGTADLLASLKSIQIHPNEVVSVKMQEGIRQTAKSDETLITPENAGGTETITITASQWNEVY